MPNAQQRAISNGSPTNTTTISTSTGSNPMTRLLI
jgi:hypothetical protein